MSIHLHPDSDSRRIIAESVGEEINLCYTCGSCLNGCPVNAASILLSPIKIVRLAIYGLLDDLIHLPEIWYCQRCNSCLQGCPMTVKPSALIAYLRAEAIRREVVGLEK